MSEHRGKYFEGKDGKAEREKVLIVEGVDDAYFFDSLLSQANADPASVGIIYIEGNDIQKNLGMLLKRPEITRGIIKSFAFILDADIDAAKKNQEIQQAFMFYGYTITSPSTFVKFNNFSAGYTLLPSPTESGSLERVLLRTVDRDIRVAWTKDLLVRCEQLFDQRFDHLYKRQADIFLSCNHRTKSRGVGKSFSDGIFQNTHPSLDTIKGFVSAFLIQTSS